MRCFSFLLCFALLIAQLGFPVGAMAAAWQKGDAVTLAHVQTDAEAASSGIQCEAFGLAACTLGVQCDACQLCHGCHAPGLLASERIQPVVVPTRQAPPTSAVGYLSADTPPDFKPPIL
ncbi:hypothetical protein FXN63_23730 [Pigmentiphaga aceris]|uniref:DUF2946 domain-containing protein n=1 Tax=Pigmentiphaga aceris TaxID=1940612 RepID=A0A5C0B5E2_9BURK|nr:hypothetical protein [Pigmentiphaga aceris]QEI08510.1 hypothetical protein FXN63_23730 [Pigmentiphaga aceris]